MLILLVCLLAIVTVLAQDHPKPTGVLYFERKKVDEALNGASLLVATNNFRVQGGHRTEPGVVEFHDFDTDIFYIQEGSANLVTGGQVVGLTVKGPGESVGKSIEGGITNHLAKGDVFIIPNKVPHWFKEIDGSCIYYVVKVKK